jgi:hypothetical protein
MAQVEAWSVYRDYRLPGPVNYEEHEKGIEALDEIIQRAFARLRGRDVIEPASTQEEEDEPPHLPSTGSSGVEDVPKLYHKRGAGRREERERDSDDLVPSTSHSAFNHQTPSPARSRLSPTVSSESTSENVLEPESRRVAGRRTELKRDSDEFFPSPSIDVSSNSVLSTLSPDVIRESVIDENPKPESRGGAGRRLERECGSGELVPSPSPNAHSCQTSNPVRSNLSPSVHMDSIMDDSPKPESRGGAARRSERERGSGDLMPSSSTDARSAFYHVRPKRPTIDSDPDYKQCSYARSPDETSHKDRHSSITQNSTTSQKVGGRYFLCNDDVNDEWIVAGRMSNTQNSMSHQNVGINLFPEEEEEDEDSDDDRQVPVRKSRWDDPDIIPDSEPTRLQTQTSASAPVKPIRPVTSPAFSRILHAPIPKPAWAPNPVLVPTPIPTPLLSVLDPAPAPAPAPVLSSNPARTTDPVTYLDRDQYPMHPPVTAPQPPPARPDIHLYLDAITDPSRQSHSHVYPNIHVHLSQMIPPSNTDPIRASANSASTTRLNSNPVHGTFKPVFDHAPGSSSSSKIVCCNREKGKFVPFQSCNGRGHLSFPPATSTTAHVGPPKLCAFLLALVTFIYLIVYSSPRDGFLSHPACRWATANKRKVSATGEDVDPSASRKKTRARVDDFVKYVRILSAAQIN